MGEEKRVADDTLAFAFFIFHTFPKRETSFRFAVSSGFLRATWNDTVYSVPINLREQLGEPNLLAEQCTEYHRTDVQPRLKRSLLDVMLVSM